MSVVLSRRRAAPQKRPQSGKTPSTVGKRPKSATTLPTSALRSFGAPLSLAALLLGITLAYAAIEIHAQYAFSLEWPVVVHLRSPLVIARRLQSTDAVGARFDQGGRPLTAYQQYACAKFGPDCRLALAIQRAENPQGKCEIYHYNTDGTLDWGYFQINTVHLKRPGVNLRSLLDCKANIDFAYQLYRERGGFTPWSTYNNGAYKKYLTE